MFIQLTLFDRKLKRVFNTDDISTFAYNGQSTLVTTKEGFDYMVQENLTELLPVYIPTDAVSDQEAPSLDLLMAFMAEGKFDKDQSYYAIFKYGYQLALAKFNQKKT